jgi:hypothetical protein
MPCEEIKPREKPQKIPRAEKGKRVDNRREQDLSPTCHSFRSIAFLSQVGAHFL